MLLMLGSGVPRTETAEQLVRCWGQGLTDSGHGGRSLT